MKFRHTLIFWISVIILGITIPTGLYYLTIGSSGGMGLAGVILIGVAIITLTIVLIEQFIVKNTMASGRTILTIEIPIVLIIISTMMYSERKINYTIDEDAEWFVIVEHNDGYTRPRYSFPFNLNYDLNNHQILFIDQNEHETFKYTSVSWGGYQMINRSVVVEEKKYGFQIYFNPNYTQKEQEIDSIKYLVKEEIELKL